MESKICLYCKKEFLVKPSHAPRRKYCSRECLREKRKAILPPCKGRKNCLACGKEFIFVIHKNKPHQNFCSHKCHNPSKIKEKTCPFCKKTFKLRRKFCTPKCYYNSLTGIKKQNFVQTHSYEWHRERLKKSFEKYVIRQEGCWGWRGGPSKKYGSLEFMRKSILAHRASYILHKGNIPEGMFVCHTCDNPPCTNPDHLFLGTDVDNVRDMYKKGRHPILKGEDAPGSKLTKEQVIEIKKMLSDGCSLTKIAKLFNIHVVTIHDIKYRKTWSSL
jgi:hypothetical protein